MSTEKKKHPMESGFNILSTNRDELRRLRFSKYWNEFVRQDMIMRGFYKPNPDPDLAQFEERLAVVKKERAVHMAELQTLKEEVSESTKRAEAIDRVKAKQAELHKARLQESRQKRIESKKARIKARQEAKALWERRQNEELLYIGSQFSYIFSEKYKKGNAQKVQALGLPSLNSDLELLKLLNDLGQTFYSSED